jgi:hypothetical protein
MVDLIKNPESFEEAHNHPEVDKKFKWRHAISNKFLEMSAKRNWFEKSQRFPTDKIVSNIFKQNETFRAQFVAWAWLLCMLTPALLSEAKKGSKT